MPLTRYQIRNEYSLADPELYKAADRDDPEALLEGVAMAGLVGVLRQLGDLAEFAAEIFRDLHEEVTATAARGQRLMVRVQQLEAEFPSIERAFLSQTNHSLFFTNTGVDWHPNLRMEQNLITRGDLPRCVMDSYEECRGLPRLFLLDKFDVAGAGACLKRYTDPSFFKVEAALSEIPLLEIQREKKIRKVKKKGSHWRNGETPEIIPTSHANLHQLFLEERIEKGHSDPARIVKLKKGQLNASLFDSRPGKSYMEKFLETTREQNLVRDISVTPFPLKIMSDNSSEPALEIQDVSTVSPMKRSSRGNESTCISSDAHEVVLKPSVDELYGEVIDGQIVKVPEPSAADKRDETPSSLHKVTMEKEIVVDEGKMDAIVDGDNSDEMTDEVDNYMDALTTMELEMETDNEYRPKTGLGFSNVEKLVMDSDGNRETLEFQAYSSDSQSIGNFSASDDGNSSLKIGRSSFSSSDTLSNLAENVPSDGEGSSRVFLSSNQLPADVGVLGTKSHDLVVPNDLSIDKDNTCALGEASTNSSLIEDSNPPLLALDLVETALREKLDETPSGTMKPRREFSVIYERETNLDDSLTAVPEMPSLTRDVTCFTVCDKSHPVDKLDAEDPNLSSDDLLHLSNNSELATEEKSSNDSHDEKLKTDFVDENCPENKVNNKIGSPNLITSPTKELVPCSVLLEREVHSSSTLLTDSSDTGKPDNVVPNVDDAFLETGVYMENSTSVVDILLNCSFKDQQVSDTVGNVAQGELDLAERGALYSEANLADISGTVDGAKIGVSTCKVEATEGDVELPSNRTDSSVPENHVVCDDFVTEGVQAESIYVTSTVTHDVPAEAPVDDDIDTVVRPSPYIICSRSKDIVNLQESPSGIMDPHMDGLELNDLVSQACLRGSEAENKMTQLEVAAKDFDSASSNLVSHDESNLEMVQGVHNLSLAETTKKRLPADDFTIAAASSELNGQEMESNCLHHSHFLEDGDNGSSLPTAPFPDVDTSLEQLLQLQADQLDVEFMKGEASSDSAIRPSEGIQFSEGTNLERLFSDASESCQEDLLSQRSPSECLQQSTGQEINNTKPEMDPSGSIFPSFGLLQEAAQVNLEEMPPLPPLPPLQWRIGKIQRASLFSQREFFDRCQESCLSIFPFGDCEKGQSGFPSQQRDILHPVDPFLPIIAVEVEKLHVPQRGVDNEMQPTLSSLQFPSLAGHANCQKNCLALEGTQLLNPLLTLSTLPDEKPENGCLASEHEEVHASSNPFLSLPGIEDASSKHGHVSSPEKLIQHLNELEPEPGLEGKTFEGTPEWNPSDTSVLPAGKFEEQPHTGLPSSEGKTPQQSPENSEDERWNPSDTSALPPGKVEKQPQHGLPSSEGTLQCISANSEGECRNPSDTSALPPGPAEEQLQHVLRSSEGESARSSNPFALLPTSEVGKVNGSSIVKLSCPRNRPECKTFQGMPEWNPSDTSVLPAGKFEEQPHPGLLSSEGKIIQQTPESSEDERRNPSDTSALPPGKVEKRPQHGLPSSEGTLQCTSESSEGERGNPSDTFALPPGMVEEQLQHVLPCSGGESAWSSNSFALLPTSEVGKVNGSSIVKLPHPRNPLIDAVVALDKSKLRKVSERVRPQIGPKVEERDSLLEQIRTKSFNLKPAALSRPSILGPKTNLKVAAILEKANAIRQATAGSDEDDDEDWSDA